METRHHRPGLIRISDDLAAVLRAVSDAGGRPYLAGGCVRDALVDPSTEPKDVDLEVFGLDVEALKVAVGSTGDVVEVGAAFSVLTLRRGDELFDVALPRRRVESTAARHGISVVPDPSASLTEASACRDVTINALLYDASTAEVVDCWDGMADLDARVLRHTSDAFVTDPLRVLRGAQLAARLDLTMAEETVALARSLHDTYPELATERVWGEWSKIATRGRRPSAALEVLTATGWESHLPDLAVLHTIEQDPRWHPEGDVHVHSGLAADKAAELAARAGLDDEQRTVVVLAALVHDFGKATHTQRVVEDDGSIRITSHGHDVAGVEPALRFLASIGAPAAVRRQVGPLVREHMCTVATKDPSRAAVRRLVRRLVPATMEQWELVCTADKGGRGSGSVPPGTEAWMAHYESEKDTLAPLLRGRDLVDAGLTPGPTFRSLLADALTAQDQGEFDDPAGALAWLRDRLR